MKINIFISSVEGSKLIDCVSNNLNSLKEEIELGNDLDYYTLGLFKISKNEWENIIEETEFDYIYPFTWNILVIIDEIISSNIGVVSKFRFPDQNIQLLFCKKTNNILNIEKVISKKTIKSLEVNLNDFLEKSINAIRDFYNLSNILESEECGEDELKYLEDVASRLINP